MPHIDDDALPQGRTVRDRPDSINDGQNGSPFVFLQQPTELRIVVSSGIRSGLNPANWRRMVVSYNASSIVGALYPN